MPYIVVKCSFGKYYKLDRCAGFKFFVEYRQNLRKDLFPETAGLGGSQGEKWYEGSLYTFSNF